MLTLMGAVREMGLLDKLSPQQIIKINGTLDWLLDVRHGAQRQKTFYTELQHGTGAMVAVTTYDFRDKDLVHKALLLENRLFSNENCI